MELRREKGKVMCLGWGKNRRKGKVWAHCRGGEGAQVGSFLKN